MGIYDGQKIADEQMAEIERRLKTDQELIEAVAVEVMGWRNSKINPIHYWYSEHDKNTYPKDNWNPLTDANHRDMVVERMRELGFNFKIWGNPGSKRAGASFEKHYIRGTAIEDSIGYAVCLAAREAIRSMATERP